jgi:hypothetical protein
MKGNHFNKLCQIGPGGINCGCCVDFAKKRQNHKRSYRRLRRVLEKREFKKVIKFMHQG